MVLPEYTIMIYQLMPQINKPPRVKLPQKKKKNPSFSDICELCLGRWHDIYEQKFFTKNVFSLFCLPLGLQQERSVLLTAAAYEEYLIAILTP